MDKIEKFLKKFGKKEQEAFLLVMHQLNKDFTKIPGIKKLSQKRNHYRIRIGRYRLIFTIKKKEIEIIKITKRDNQTYKRF